MILAKLFKLRLFIILYYSQWNNSFCKAKYVTLHGCQKMLCIYRIKLDFRLRENAMKEIQDTIESAGMAGQVKIF